MASALKNRYLNALDPAEQQGSEANSLYFDRAKSFDPSAALDKYAGAASSRFRRDVGQTVGHLRGQQVGMGRLDTGFATQDEDRVVTDLGERYQDDINSHALDATSLELRNNEGIGAFGQNQQNSYLDLLSGGLDRETAESNAKKQFWSNLLGSAVGAAGYATGMKFGK